ncbi:cation:proton antiporter [Streptomyces sp. ICBB 8177]|uniref:cation:proton antiporter domain-containing protein n=1 Tax=Streptomyces sp. ICBB 8177 TaxID=563922 RepID=UPI001F5410B9|nr:cation:proton antiporter [Streptomyces sp. ICBB 8177]
MSAVTAAFALTSRRLAASPVSAAMVFVGAGVVLGPVGLDLLSLRHGAGPLRTLVETALTLVLFTDATNVRPADLRRGGPLPGRLLSIGLVLTIGAGWLLAWPLLPGLTVWELALVGAILAPTDAALGKSAISDPRVPGLVRQTLNVESRLNDGLVLPLLVLFLSAVPGTSYAHQGVADTFWRSLLLSPALGLLVGGAGGQFLGLSLRHSWIARDWLSVYALAPAAAAYALAAATHGSGFIGAWVAGFAFAYTVRRVEHTKGEVARTTDLAENLGDLLAMVSLLSFGAVALGPALAHLSWRITGYAVLSLTVVRMAPVALALAGSGLKAPTVVYVGWFGPRGLASVVFGLLVAEEHLHGVDLMSRVVAITVGLSVLLHGTSAAAFAVRYGHWYQHATATKHDLRESAATPITPRRRGTRVQDG